MTTAVDIRSKQATHDPQNVDEVILALQSEQLVLTKDKKGQVGNQKTRYADLVQVNEIVLARLNDLATIWTCRPHLEDGVFGLHYSLRHVPSSTEKTGVWPLKLSDNPQQMGSATTYGRRYALLAVTGIVAEDEDDDGQAAVTKRTAPARRPAAPQPAPAAVPDETPPPATVTMRRGNGQPPVMKALMAAFTKNGLGGSNQSAARHMFAENIIGRPLESSNDLNPDEAKRIIDHLDKHGANLEGTS